jgi:spermidine synthase
VIADARNFLLTMAERYDVISSEPSNPWIGGVASLFTREFFALARQHLKPGGIMLQWVQAYNLSPEDLRMIVKTFRGAFPATTIWHVSGDFLLLGRTEPAPMDLNLLKARYQANPALRRDLGYLDIHGWPGVLSYFLLGEADAARYSDGVALNTDDRLSLEFSAPRALFLDTGRQNYQLMRSFRVEDLPAVTPDSRGELERPDVRAWIGAAYLARGAQEEALRYLPR